MEVTVATVDVPRLTAAVCGRLLRHRQQVHGVRLAVITTNTYMYTSSSSNYYSRLNYCYYVIA